MSCYLYVDNSNFYLGMHRHRMYSPLCIDVPYLVRLWTGALQGPYGYVVGSAMDTPQKDAAYWNRWEQASAGGLRVVASGKREKEVFVDDAVHAQMLFRLLQPRDVGDTMVLVSGDGNNNQGRTSFPGVVRAALQLGWPVHVWTWKESMNNVWRSMVNEQKSLCVSFLNDHLSRLINVNLAFATSFDKLPTEEARMRRAVQEARLYAHACPGKCGFCTHCHRHKRLPIHVQCSCHGRFQQ